MRMYPSYRLQDVLNEYAITFFALLNQGYRLRHEHYLMMCNIISFPHIEDDKARRQFIAQLEWAIKEPGDILNNEDDEDNGIEQVKQLFGKL